MIFSAFSATPPEISHLALPVTAAALLGKEDLPIGKIAALSGFGSKCQFCKKFKQIFGITPKAYTKQPKDK